MTPEATPPQSPSISVVIPNWNGESLLRRHLPAVLNELVRYGTKSECIVVDDGSTDNSVAFLREYFSDVRVIQRSQNQGFSTAANVGIAAASNSHVLLLNNDVAVTPGCFGEMVREFSDDTFAVAALQKQEGAGGLAVDGFNVIQWRDGHFELQNSSATAIPGKQPRLGYCSAGCSLFSREKLLSLGGFCKIFDPFYYEDAELGIQAAKRGWVNRFAPSSIVYHHSGSTARFKKWTLRFLPVRNYFILHWLTVDGRKFWLEHIQGVSGRLFWWTIQGRLRYTVGFLLASLKLPKIILYRRRRAHGWKRSLKDLVTS